MLFILSLYYFSVVSTCMTSGVSSFFGLAVTCLFLPLNHYAGKVVVDAQDNLMKARDERVALMNEVFFVQPYVQDSSLMTLPC